MAQLPPRIAALIDDLADLPGVVAVVLGGSRATGTNRADSDWDLGVYYRGAFDPAGVRRLAGASAVVSGVGEWGPIMNGGAWLTIAGAAVDVLYRDLDVIERWTREAEEGRFEILTQNGYLVGAPTYLPAGELALCRVLHGEVARPAFSDALAASAQARWEGKASVSLMFAGIHAEAFDAVACVGMLGHAVLCAAHARLAARREWVLNEKRLVERAGLGKVQRLLASPGDLPQLVTAVADATGVEPLAAR
jgi:nucleotidyltransferase-like protein